MTELILALILAALVVLIIVLLRRRSRTRDASADKHRGAKADPQPAPPRDPFAHAGTGGDPRALRAGDMVDYLGRRYFVRGSLRLTEGGYTWSEHFLHEDRAEGDEGGGDPPARQWLSVEEDPELEVVLWTQHHAEDLTPAEKRITLEGVEYQRSEHGVATYRSEGTTGLGADGRVEYVDYEAPHGRYLAFERFGDGSWEAGLGERVPNGSLTIYPGS